MQTDHVDQAAISVWRWQWFIAIAILAVVHSVVFFLASGRTPWGVAVIALVGAVIGWLWLDQAIAAVDLADAGLREGIYHACRFFYEEEMPQAACWLDIVAAPRGAVAEIPEAAFG